jgi:hypothetical protein
VDLVEIASDPDDLFNWLNACPVEYKAGAPKVSEDGVRIWDTDKMQSNPLMRTTMGIGMMPRREPPPWWKTARARQQEREARIVASQASRSAQMESGLAQSERLDRAPRTESVSMPASGTEGDEESRIALARKQQREESRAKYERGRR